MFPKNVERIIPFLETLAVHGAVRSREGDDCIEWLQSIGVVQHSNNPDWLVPLTRWVEDTLPATSDLELLRKTAIRDPRYRAHLDFSVCSVLNAVGKAERWARFEELLLGPYLPFAPRLVQLLEWQTSRVNLRAAELDERAWRDADALVSGDALNDYQHWDRVLWGSSGNSSELFPLLGDLYVPLAVQPVHVDLSHGKSWQATDGAGALLIRLIQAARSGEGIRYDTNDEQALQYLLLLGLPVRKAGSLPNLKMLYLVGCVTVTVDSCDPSNTPHLSPLPCGLQEPVKASEVLLPEMDPLRDEYDFWHVLENPSKHRKVFFSISPEEDSWPLRLSDSVPPWASIPGREILKDVGRPKSLSPFADDALLKLGQHPLYGFLLQLLLLEALDRELGDETLLLAPPLERRVEQIEAATRVLYRPRVSRDGISEGVAFPYYQLGILDEVFAILAKSFAISGVAFPYISGEEGPWARSLRLFRTAELVIGRHDRWSLAGHVLDRLHGGGLMQAVIRRGHPVRERLHQELKALWQTRHESSLQREVAHG